MEWFSKYIHVNRNSSSNSPVTKSPIQVAFVGEKDAPNVNIRGKELNP